MFYYSVLDQYIDRRYWIAKSLQWHDGKIKNFMHLGNSDYWFTNIDKTSSWEQCHLLVIIMIIFPGLLEVTSTFSLLFYYGMLEFMVILWYHHYKCKSQFIILTKQLLETIKKFVGICIIILCNASTLHAFDFKKYCYNKCDLFICACQSALLVSWLG